jgi:AbrB family looped-hinge helix DNA binding protein
METTRLSTKGQIVLPQRVRSLRAWGPGTEFIVEEVADGILLRPSRLFPLANIDDVAGYLRFRGKARTTAQMKKAIADEVKRRHDRGRY